MESLAGRRDAHNAGGASARLRLISAVWWDRHPPPVRREICRSLLRPRRGRLARKAKSGADVEGVARERVSGCSLEARHTAGGRDDAGSIPAIPTIVARVEALPSESCDGRRRGGETSPSATTHARLVNWEDVATTRRREQVRFLRRARHPSFVQWEGRGPTSRRRVFDSLSSD